MIIQGEPSNSSSRCGRHAVLMRVQHEILNRELDSQNMTLTNFGDIEYEVWEGETNMRLLCV